jgi:RNA polymerase sigma-70 factor (ECF subfamily)
MDKQLQLLIEGDHSAFQDIFRENYTRAFRYFLKRIAVVETAQELTQQCFIRLWQYHASLSSTHSIDQQIFVIARSLLLNYLKQENRREAFKQEVQLQLASEEEERQAGRKEENSFERRNFLTATLQTLPADERDILQLKYISGYTNKEISEALSLPLKTIEGRISRAYKRLGTIIHSI